MCEIPCFHGNCYGNIGNQSCICDPGWSTDDCSVAECPPLGCLNHGYCISPGTCLCGADWGGLRCTQHSIIESPPIYLVLTFILVSFCGYSIGELLEKKLPRLIPKITVYLIIGILFGPYAGDLITTNTVQSLDFVSKSALGFIALSAGAELYLQDIKESLRSVVYISLALLITTMIIIIPIFASMHKFTSLMIHMTVPQMLAVSFLFASLMTARSPSSAIAVIRTLGASGYFTSLGLSITVVTDIVVVFCYSIAAVFITKVFSIEGVMTESTIIIIVRFIIETVFSIVLGAIFSFLISWLLWPSFKKWWNKICFSSSQPSDTSNSSPPPETFSVIDDNTLYDDDNKKRERSKTAIEYPDFDELKTVKKKVYRIIKDFLKTFFILLFSWVSFLQQNYIPGWIQPLLLLMSCGFCITNYTIRGHKLQRYISVVSPSVYALFFTLTGAALDLHSLVISIGIVCIQFISRLIAIIIGCYAGGKLSHESESTSRFLWMSLITQAGVTLGLAHKIMMTYPQWGTQFASLVIGIVIFNQIFGPPFHSWVLKYMGETNRVNFENLSTTNNTHNSLILPLLSDQNLTSRSLSIDSTQLQNTVNLSKQRRQTIE